MFLFGENLRSESGFGAGCRKEEFFPAPVFAREKAICEGKEGEKTPGLRGHIPEAHDSPVRGAGGLYWF